METTFLQVKGAKGFAIIDAEDYEKVSPFEWQIETSGRAGWFHIGCRIGDKATGQKCYRLSHMILGVEKSDGDGRAYVTYLNGNRFDLRKANLCLSKNVSPVIGETKFYYFCDKKRRNSSWRLYVYLSPTQVSLGSYTSEKALKDVIQFIKDSNFPLSTKAEIEAIKPTVRAWALENGITNLPVYGTVKPKYEIGDERVVDKDFVQIKTDSGWQMKHYFIWKQQGRRIPKTHFLLFKDGNKRNFDIENLELVSQSEAGHRLALSQRPAELRPLLSVVRELQQELDKQNKKKTRLVKVIGTEKLAIVDTEDFEKVKDFEWKLLNSQGKKVVGYRAKIGHRQYKIATLAHLILDIDPKEKVRISQINKRTFDYRQKNLSVHYFSRPGTVNKPSFGITLAKNRKASKSNHAITVWFLNKRTMLGYYVSEDAAKAVIEFATAWDKPLSNWEDFKVLRNEARRWAIANGHANKSTVLIGQEQRKDKPFNLHIFFIKKDTSKTWRVIMLCRPVFGKKHFFIGHFSTEEIAKTVVDFINNCELPMTNKDEAEKLRTFVKSWAIAKDYLNQSPQRNQFSKPIQDVPFNLIQPRGEISVCQATR
ncbi:MAG TPA: HNH endonuclease signature motif containing protein [Pyrinomonadaceae bacterium]|jgi:hypothetical protein